jgi:hypothetical protein
MFGYGRQLKPCVHRLFPYRRSWRWKSRIGEIAGSDSVVCRAAVSIPKQITPTTRAKMEADLAATLGATLVRFVLALNARLILLPEGAKMERRSGTALARLAMTHVHTLGLAGRERT